MKSHLLCVGLGLLLGFTIVGIRRMQRQSALPPAEAVLEVNGTKILEPEYLSRLRGKSGAEVLATMTQQLLVSQYAISKGIKLSEAEETDLKEATKNIPNPDVRDYVLAERRSQQLLHKVIVSDVGEQELKKIYELFKDELRQYEVSVIVLATQSDAKAVWLRLQEKILSFEQLSKTYSLAPNPEGRVGFMSLAEIRRLFGEVAADAFAAGKPNTVFPPMYCNQGMMLLKLGRIREEYKDVKYVIENIVVQGHKERMRRELLKKAVVHSKLMGPAGMPVTGENLTGASATPTPTVPKLAPTPMPTSGLIKPTNSATSTPTPGLLRPGE